MNREQYTRQVLSSVEADNTERGTVKVLITMSYSLAAIADSLEKLASVNTERKDGE